MHVHCTKSSKRQNFHNQSLVLVSIKVYSHDILRQKSKRAPSINRELALETYLTFAKRKILHTLDHRPPNQSQDNLFLSERREMSSLRKRTDIVIKPVNKRSTTVVMATEDYKKSYGPSKQHPVLQKTAERSDRMIFGGDLIIPYRYDQQKNNQ